LNWNTFRSVYFVISIYVLDESIYWMTYNVMHVLTRNMGVVTGTTAKTIKGDIIQQRIVVPHSAA